MWLCHKDILNFSEGDYIYIKNAIAMAIGMQDIIAWFMPLSRKE